YLDSNVHYLSSGVWEDFGQLYDYLKNRIDFVGPLENYKFIVGDKEMNFGWSKMQIIDFLKQQKCSIDNPVKISDKKKGKADKSSIDPSYRPRSEEDEEI
ncbi:26787_t:CDS:2, partial [Gigaspora margarita]